MVETQVQRNVCRSCSSDGHGGTGTGDQPGMCTAWGKQNHFAKVCQSKDENKQGAMQCFEVEGAVP